MDDFWGAGAPDGKKTLRQAPALSFRLPAVDADLEFANLADFSDSDLVL